MKWLKQKWNDNQDAVLIGAVAFVGITAGVVGVKLVRDNAKLRLKLADAAKDALENGIEAFHEGYAVAIAEIEMIAENKEMQKALKASSKASA